MLRKIEVLGNLADRPECVWCLVHAGTLVSLSWPLAGPPVHVAIGTRWFRDMMDETAFAKVVASVEARTPLGVASGPDDVADAALFFVSDASRHITGELMTIDAGLHLGRSP